MSTSVHDSQVQVGDIVYDTSNLESSLTAYFENYNRLLEEAGPVPPNLALNPVIFGIPQIGHVFLCTFFWRGPRNEAFKAWLGRVAALAPAVVDAEAVVKTTTPSQAMANMALLIPPRMYCHVQTVNVTHWSSQVVEVCKKHAARIPLTGGGISIHELRAGSPSSRTDVPNSMFPCRQPHIMLEFLGAGNTPEEGKLGRKWAVEIYGDMVKADAALERSYVSLTAPELAVLDKMYGEKAEELRGLKKELDPKGVFGHAVPKIF